MNKAITDGVVFMPPAFEGGLDVWSSGDGTPGSATYDGAANAALVPADQDFGSCLELQKTQATQMLRHKGKTPLFPGCYLMIRARVKAISGNLPTVRIAGWAGTGSNQNVAGVTQIGSEVTLTTYGKVVEITAIVGTGRRGGVDMPWGPTATFGYFGLDLTGTNGGIVRIDDIEIEDVTNVFLREMIGVVDVRDYGAVGDGTTDDSAAFEAADHAANGRKILVPPGTYFLNDDVSLNAEVEFEGTVTMPTDKMLLLLKDYALPTYIAAFDDEELAFKKAFQALLNNSDHESLDLGGRKIRVTAPIDMAAAVPNKTSYATRRVIRNGQLEAANTSAWDTNSYTSSATYDPASATRLSNVANVANIPVGSLVEGIGVGREVYVRSKNVGAQEITLSAPLYDAAGTQVFTFRSFKYMLDFSGFQKLDKFAIENLEIQCESRCSGIKLAPAGATFNLSGSFVSRPKDRGITSIGSGCQGMLIDRCQFLSAEDALDVVDRNSIAINTNNNDVKLRHCRATRFKHFAVLSGTYNTIIGNHFFQGDTNPAGVRSAGLVMAGNVASSTISGNYVDNCFIEWTNEHDPSPDSTTGFSYSAIGITDNIFLAGNVASWFSFIILKPHGSGHYLNGVTVSGNKFRCINGSIDRVDRVDTSFAGMDYSRFKNVTFEGNTYHNITKQPMNPLRVHHSQATAASTWVVESSDLLPFGATVRAVDSVVQQYALRDSSGALAFETPQVRVGQGSNGDEVHLVWSRPVRGDVSVTMRIDR